MEPRLIDLPTFTDGSGSLTAVEKVPFDIKRAFWIHDITGWRGGHAHKGCHQLIVALHKSVLVKSNKKQWPLLGPCVGLYVPPGNYIELFGPGAVVLVLCSDYYDAEDYIEKEDSMTEKGVVGP